MELEAAFCTEEDVLVMSENLHTAFSFSPSPLVCVDSYGVLKAKGQRQSTVERRLKCLESEVGRARRGFAFCFEQFASSRR